MPLRFGSITLPNANVMVPGTDWDCSWKHSSAAYLNHTLAAVSTVHPGIASFEASKREAAIPASPSPARIGTIHFPLLGFGTIDLPQR